MSATETLPATRACNRCAGTGNRRCRQAHLGVPGLCWDCNGRGIVPQTFYADRRRAAAEAKAENIAGAAFLVAFDAHLASRHDARMARLIAGGMKETQASLGLRGYRDILLDAYRESGHAAERAEGHIGQYAMRAVEILGLPSPLTQTKASLLAGLGL